MAYSTATEFDLVELIDQPIESSDEPDPHVLAFELLDRIAEDRVWAALAWALPHHVPERVRTRRAEVLSEWRGASYSAKWDNVRRSIFASSYHAGSGPWLKLGTCSAEDCEAIAADYERRERENGAQKERFQTLAGMTRDAGVRRVGALDESEVAGALNS